MVGASFLRPQITCKLADVGAVEKASASYTNGQNYISLQQESCFSSVFSTAIFQRKHIAHIASDVFL